MSTRIGIRVTGITLAGVGVGVLLLRWLAARDVLHASGEGADVFLGFSFLGRPITWVDLNLHDTYFLVTNPAWSWLALLLCLVGAVMAARPDWLSKNPGGRE